MSLQATSTAHAGDARQVLSRNTTVLLKKRSKTQRFRSPRHSPLRGPGESTDVRGFVKPPESQAERLIRRCLDHSQQGGNKRRGYSSQK